MSRVKQIFKLFMGNKQSSKTVSDFGVWLLSTHDASEKEDVLQQHWTSVKSAQSAESIEQSYRETRYKIKKRSEPTIVEKTSVWGRLSRVAAMLLLPVLSILATYFYTINRTTPQNWIEIYASYGQTRTAVLPDGSSLTINAGSKLIYPEKFCGKNRQVFLSGEAYAVIAKDASHPFVLSAGDVDIRVLGTAFNVKSYAEDTEIEVALVEGSVRMNSKLPVGAQAVVLSPGELVKLDKESGEVQRYNFPVDSYVPHVKGGGLRFINQRLCDIMAQIERSFDVRIIIKDKELENKRYYSAFVNNETLEQILSTLNANNAMKITQEDNVIYITNKMKK